MAMMKSMEESGSPCQYLGEELGETMEVANRAIILDFQPLIFSLVQFLGDQRDEGLVDGMEVTSIQEK